MKSIEKIRSRNRVKIFMRLPFTVARWAGVYIPLPKNSVRLCSFRILITLLLYFSVTTSRNINRNIAFSDIIYLIGDFFRAVLQPIFLIETIRKGKYFIAALKRLDDVERDLSTLGKPSFSDEGVFRTLIIHLILMCGTMIGGFARLCRFPSTPVTFMIQYALVNIIMFYFYATWFVLIAFLSMVDQQFAFLTRRLRVPTKNDFTTRKFTNKIWKEHSELIKHHSRACWAVDDACQWFELSFLFYAGMYFFTSTFGFYVMSIGIHYFYRNQTWCLGGDLLTNVLWVALRIDELWAVLRFCSAAEKRSQEFSNRLHQVMIAANKHADGIFKLHFAMKPKVEIWACGFFRIDKTLAYSMIGAAATYLAVVYQSIDLDSDKIELRPKTNSTIT